VKGEMDGIREVLAAPRSPWQNAYAEPLIGFDGSAWSTSLVFHETGLRWVLKDCFKYCERGPTHLSLEKDAPVSRPVEPPSLGHVIEIPRIGGLDPSLYALDRSGLPDARLRMEK